MRLTARNRQHKKLTAKELLAQADNSIKEGIISRSLDYTELDEKYTSVRCPATKLWLPVAEFYDSPGSSNLNPLWLRRTSRYAWMCKCWCHVKSDWVRACGTKKFDDQIHAIVNEQDPHKYYVPSNLGEYLV